MASSAEDLSQFDVSNEEKDKLVAEVIRYVLFKNHQHAGCPIKRDELTQIITKNYRQRSLTGFIIEQAKDKLSSIFGYEMRELQRARSSSSNHARSSQQSVGEAKSYIIMSKLPAELYRNYVEDENNAKISGFTFVVVSIVHIAGGRITEENLWHHLQRMGLDENAEHHVLGNPKEALETLVQQRFLQKGKSDGPEGNHVFYEVAERGLDAAVSEKIKEYVAEIGKKGMNFTDDN